MFILNQLDFIRDDANKFIIQERMRYNNIYVAIEEYICSNNIIIGGTLGVHMLLQQERTPLDFVYEVYCENSFKHCNNIANIIAGILDCNLFTDNSDEDTTDNNVVRKINEHPQIVVMKTVIAYDRYQILINGRLIITLFNLPERTEVSLTKLIEPIKVKSYNKDNIELLVLSPEIYLINAYRILGSPNKIDLWKETIENESILYDYLKKRIPKLNKSGGGELMKDSQKLSKYLIDNFVRNTGRVLIGDHAMYIYNGNAISNDIVEVISSDISADIDELRKIIASYYNDNTINFTHKTRSLHILQDNRLTRTTIRLKERDIMYIYNNMKYDLIPTLQLSSANNTILIGNPIVMMRFLLIDYYMIKWILLLGYIDENFAKFKQNKILNNIISIRNKFEFSIDNTTIRINKITDLFPSDLARYVGVYSDDIIYTKNKMKEGTKYFDYYPQEYIHKHDSYRVI